VIGTSFRLLFSALKMDMTCFSETAVYFQRTKRRYIPEDRTLRLNKFLGLTEKQICGSTGIGLVLFKLYVNNIYLISVMCTHILSQFKV
jgi:hypothetical protein